jgi:hypothetical protein
MINDKLANKLHLANLALARIKLHCATFPFAIHHSRGEKRYGRRCVGVNDDLRAREIDDRFSFRTPIATNSMTTRCKQSNENALCARAIYHRHSIFDISCTILRQSCAQEIPKIPGHVQAIHLPKHLHATLRLPVTR